LSPVVDVIRTYLELRTPSELRPASAPVDGPSLRFIRYDALAVERYRHLYAIVGAPWHWHDRDAWADARLASHLAQPTVTVWECLAGEHAAGFFELERRADGSVEIAYFGLAPAFIGLGIGKAMLTRAVEEAWALGASRVWLHTCTLDSPHALPNYLARGFTAVGTESYGVQLP
jgi:GNAT superfamily N-acetyltransferase